LQDAVGEVCVRLWRVYKAEGERGESGRRGGQACRQAYSGNHPSFSYLRPRNFNLLFSSLLENFF
jgi:hypothetical protein